MICIEHHFGANNYHAPFQPFFCCRRCCCCWTNTHRYKKVQKPLCFPEKVWKNCSWLNVIKICSTQLKCREHPAFIFYMIFTLSALSPPKLYNFSLLFIGFFFRRRVHYCQIFTFSSCLFFFRLSSTLWSSIYVNRALTASAHILSQQRRCKKKEIQQRLADMKNADS